MVIVRLLVAIVALALPSLATVTYTAYNGDGTVNGSGGCTIKGIRGGYSNAVSCRFVLSGAGSYTVSGSNQFFPSMRWCTLAVSSGSITGCSGTSGTLTGSESPAVELRLYYENDNDSATPASHCPYGNGDYTCTFTGITFNSTSVPVTLILRERVAPAVMGTANKQTASDLVAAGCTYTASYLVQYPDLCPQISATHPNASYDPPADGASITDERYGTRGCVLAHDVVQAPIQRYVSAGGKYIILQANGGGFTPDGIYDMDTCAKVYDYPSGVSGCQFPTDLKKLTTLGLPELTLICYGSVGNTLVRLRGLTPPTLNNDGIVWTSKHGEQMIQDGGSSTLTSDGRKVFYGCPLSAGCGQNGNPISNYRYFYMVDVYSFATIADMDMMDARVATTFGSITPSGRAVLVTDKGPDGRYAIQIGNGVYPAMYLWAKEDGSWGTSGVENDFTGSQKWAALNDCGTYLSYCTGVVHQTPGNANGTVFWLKSTSESGPKAGGISNSLLSSPVLRSTPAEWGGGGSMIHMPVEHVTSTVFPQSLIVGSVEPASTDNPQMPILSVTGNPAVITLDETTASQNLSPITSIPGLSVGGQVDIGCYGRTSGSTQQIEGFYVVSAIQTGPYRLTLSGLSWTGTSITSRRCAVTLRQAPQSSQTPLHIAIARLAPFGNGVRAVQIFPIAKQPSTHMYGADDAIEYFSSQTKPQLAPNGKYVTGTTNYGIPNGMLTVRWEVPWQLRATLPNELAPSWSVDFRPNGTGSLLVHAMVPTAHDLVCIASTSWDLLTSPTTITLSGPGVERAQTFTGTSRTPYYWGCSTTLKDFASVGIAVPQ